MTKNASPKPPAMMSARQAHDLLVIAQFEAGEFPEGTSLCISARMWGLLRAHGYVTEDRKITDDGLRYLGRARA